MINLSSIEYYIKNKNDRIKSKSFFYDETAYVYFYMMIDFILSRTFTLSEYENYKVVIEKNGSDKTIWYDNYNDTIITAKEYLLKKLKEKTDITKTIKDPVVIPQPPKIISDLEQKSIDIQDKIDNIINETKNALKVIDRKNIIITGIILIVLLYLIKK